MNSMTGVSSDSGEMNESIMAKEQKLSTTNAIPNPIIINNNNTSEKEAATLQPERITRTPFHETTAEWIAMQKRIRQENAEMRQWEVDLRRLKAENEMLQKQIDELEKKSIS